MNLYLISQEKSKGNDDSYDCAVVVAKSAKDARTIHPREGNIVDGDGYSWPGKVEDVFVEYLGRAKKNLKRGVVVASFNAA